MGRSKEPANRAAILKTELNAILALVQHSREALQNELSSETAQKKLFIDEKFIKKLKELSSCFGSLTDARIRLEKAEKAMEKEFTPEQEKQAVREFVAELEGRERGKFIRDLVKDYVEYAYTSGGRKAVWPEVVTQLLDEFNKLNTMPAITLTDADPE